MNKFDVIVNILPLFGLLLSIYLFTIFTLYEQSVLTYKLYPWINIEYFSSNIGYLIDQMSSVMIFVVFSYVVDNYVLSIIYHLWFMILFYYYVLGHVLYCWIMFYDVFVESFFLIPFVDSFLGALFWRLSRFNFQKKRFYFQLTRLRRTFHAFLAALRAAAAFSFQFQSTDEISLNYFAVLITWLFSFFGDIGP